MLKENTAKIFKRFVIATLPSQYCKQPATVPGIIQLNPTESMEFGLITKLSPAEMEQSALQCAYFSYLQQQQQQLLLLLLLLCFYVRVYLVVNK